jgi:Rod binding domain-containing protein
MDAPGLIGAPLYPRPEPATAETTAQTLAAAQGAEEARRVAEEFEAVFLAEMLAPMFDNLDTEGLGGGGAGERMFRPMLVEQYAKAIAQAGGVGIADSVMTEILRMQANAANQHGAADGADR